MRTIHFRTGFPVSARLLWEWHNQVATFDRLVPPWEHVEITRRPAPLQDGKQFSFRVGFGPLKLRWTGEVYEVIHGSHFKDRMKKGPFSTWEHEHHFLCEDTAHSALEDAVRYQLPFGMFGEMVAGGVVQRRLERMFRYRHAIACGDMERHFQYTVPKPKTVLVTGGTGLVGRALVILLKTLGHTVRILSRRAGDVGTYIWDPVKGIMDESALDGADAVVHLAGEGIATGRWTRKRRERILESRIAGTQLLCRAIAGRSDRPSVLVSASGVHVYPADGRPYDEGGPGGAGFLSGVCSAWEGATVEAIRAGVRTAHVRTGVVLTPSGGALGMMLPAFRWGLGGRVGSGQQHISWIALDDLLDVYIEAIENDDLAGPVNAVSPTPIRQQEFADVLGRVLKRPTALSVPAFAVRAVLGEMGEEALLADLKACPAKLLNIGFRFRCPDLETALRHLLGRRVR